MVKINRCGCRLCGDIIQSTHRHHWVQCKCKAIFTDGGLDYIRRGAKNFDDIVDLPDEESPFDERS